MDLVRLVSLTFLSCFLTLQIFGQQDVVEVGETMEDYIAENHIADIEEVVHKFSQSKLFLHYLLEQGHHLDPDEIDLGRGDVSVGKDLDVYVKHFTEHQNFTMLIVPLNIYPLGIYDTLLFSVLEVSNDWLKERYYHYDLENDSLKSQLLSLENHEMLAHHMFNQVIAQNKVDMAEVQVKLHESCISTSSVNLHVSDLDKKEKETLLHKWGILKRALSHSITMNIEMNIYVFGYDDMKIVSYHPEGEVEYKIGPRNIFTRHHFEEE